ncbi:MAG: outer membrane protein assembly factor BamB family protein [Planctomycetota bacterium]|jgi:outer membrane protein assembly factor BamB
MNRVGLRVSFALVLGFLSCGCRRTDPVEEISVGELPTGDVPAVVVAQRDWPAWRGPNGNATQTEFAVPVEFSKTRNVVWKASIPGRGHADPTVVADRVFVATAEKSNTTQSIVCLDRESGDQLWQTVIHTGGFERSVHNRSTQASNSVASDGHRAFVCLLNAEKIVLTALTLDGDIEWQTELGGFRSKFGYSASPQIHGASVIVAADHSDGGFLAAVHRVTGDILWRKSRPAESTYASPIVARVAGRDQLLICGADQVSSYDPASGDELWSCGGTTASCVGTIVWDDQSVFASGGYPGSQTLAISADGSANVLWENSQKAYVPSLLYHDGHLYCVTDKGVAWCWDASTGEQQWKGRLGGNYSASPVLIGDHIYAASEQGHVVVFEANPSDFNKVVDNAMGSEIWASPVAAHGHLFLRVAEDTGSGRQEFVYCIGQSSTATDASAEQD